jgi:general L-amino acid transport system permease protein
MTHSSSAYSAARHHGAVPFWRDIRIQRAIAQLVFVIVVLAVGVWLLGNYRNWLAERNLTFSFRFLRLEASFDLAEGIPFKPTDSYARAFLVGVVNTLRVASVGIVLATLLGLVTGVGRLSHNWLVSHIASVYIELIRNTPLLAQLFFLYFAVILKLPTLKMGDQITAITLPGPIYLSNRGLAMPWPRPSESFGSWWPFLIVALVVAVVLWILRVRGVQRTGRPSFNFVWVALAFLVVPAIGWLVVPGNPLALDVPVVKGLKAKGGTILSPEFVALTLGLVIYTGAFIAEVVRAGILAVPKGQAEAARAQGFTEMQILRLIVLPQALRVIIPPLISQYLNLTKNSSLAIGIAFLDLYAVSNTMLNQSGRVVEVFLMIMAAYLSMSLSISLIMNVVNRRIQIVER